MMGYVIIPLYFVSLASAATAGNCNLDRDCSYSSDCKADEISIVWEGESANSILLDGESIPFERIGAGVEMDSLNVSGKEWTIQNASPFIYFRKDRISGTIVPSETKNHISATIIETPRKYTEYSKAMSQRRTYRGNCEGLF